MAESHSVRSTPSPHVVAGTGPTYSLTAGERVEVVASKWVTFGTVGLSSVGQVGTPSVMSSSTVLRARNGLQVIGPDAPFIPTEMVDLESIWDLPDEQSVSSAVSSLSELGRPSEHGVTAARMEAGPLPTTGLDGSNESLPSFESLHPDIVIAKGGDQNR